MGAFASGHRNNLITQLMQQRDCGTADAATGAGDHDFTVLRANACLFKSHHAQHGGKSGGTDHHRFTAVQPFWQRYQPVRFHACLFCQTAPMVFAHAPTGQQHFLARMKTRIFAGPNGAGEINTRNHRKVADDFSFSGDGERIFIVQTGPVNIHCDIAFRQPTFFESLHGSKGFTVLLF